MVRKGTPLPTRFKEVFQTSSSLLRSDADSMIRIPIVQGERPRGDRNRQVGMLEIRPRDIQIDLPAGSNVEVTFEVDTSGLLTVIADVEVVETQFEAEINLDNVRTQTPEELRKMLAEAEERLATLRAEAAAIRSPEAQGRLAKLDEEGTVTTAREQVDAATVDLGAAAAAEDRGRDLHVELDEIEDAVALPDLVQQLTKELENADALVRRSGTAADRQELSVVQRRGQDAIQARDAGAVREQLDKATDLIFAVRRRSPDWPVQLFYALEDELRDSVEAKPLIREGKRAIAASDSPALDAVNQRLIRLLPRAEQEKHVGLRKT